VFAFGEVTDGSVTAYLIEHAAAHASSVKTVIMAANFFACLSVLCSYPLQLFPTLELDLERESSKNGGGGDGKGYTVISSSLNNSIDGNDGTETVSRNTWRRRVTLILFTFCLAMVVPDVALMISFAGSVAGTTAAIILPPALSLKIEATGLSRRKVIMNLAIIAFGLSLAVVGACSSTIRIVGTYL